VFFKVLVHAFIALGLFQDFPSVDSSFVASLDTGVFYFLGMLIVFNTLRVVVNRRIIIVTIFRSIENTLFLYSSLCLSYPFSRAVVPLIAAILTRVVVRGYLDLADVYDRVLGRFVFGPVSCIATIALSYSVLAAQGRIGFCTYFSFFLICSLLRFFRSFFSFLSNFSLLKTWRSLLSIGISCNPSR
jgi:hypothetical protein